MFGNNPTDNQTSTTTSSDPLAAAPTPVFGVDTSTQAPLPTPSISSDGTFTANAPAAETPAPTPSIPTLPSIDTTMSSAPVATTAETTNTSDDLLELKKDALSKLGPLVDKLDQTPEEKFKTTMMMIQASDDKSLIPKAYDAANSIVDEKVKAQALLDIINEINYFTSSQTAKEDKASV